MVEEVSYQGGTTINYKRVSGQQKTASLNQKQEQFLSNAQQARNTAQTSFNNMPPKAVNPTNPLMSKNEGQIKQMLETKGYTVTVLGNNLYELTKTSGEFTKTQVFDASNFSTTSYKISYEGNQGYSRYIKDGSIQNNQTLDNGN
jgi:hypothetical protein